VPFVLNFATEQLIDLWYPWPQLCDAPAASLDMGIHAVAGVCMAQQV